MGDDDADAGRTERRCQTCDGVGTYEVGKTCISCGGRGHVYVFNEAAAHEVAKRLQARVAELEAERDRLAAEVKLRDGELERQRAWIEERAAERHLLHSSVGKEDRFWNCSRSPCQIAASFLRGLRRFSCRALANGTAGGNPPQDCDWPWCGCYTETTKVLEAFEESGRFVDRQEFQAERDRLLAAAREAAAALGPFADYGVVLSTNPTCVDIPDRCPLLGSESRQESPTVGDCRRAAAARAGLLAVMGEV